MHNEPPAPTNKDRRPKGMTVLAIYDFLVGVLLLLIGLLVIFAGETVSMSLPEVLLLLSGGIFFEFALQLTGNFEAVTGNFENPFVFVMGINPIGGPIFLVFGLTSVVVGIGLLRRIKAIRILIIISATANLFVLIFALVGWIFNVAVYPEAVFSLLPILLYGWTVWYMFRPNVKKAFGVASKGVLV